MIEFNLQVRVDTELAFKVLLAFLLLILV